MNSNNKRKLLF